MRSGGRMAGYVIHTPAGLSAAGERRVAELVRMDVLADGQPAEQARRAGFDVIACDDVTSHFRTTCEAILRSREAHERELRAVDGDETFEDDQQRKVAVLTGIDEGLLERSVIVVRKP